MEYKYDKARYNKTYYEKKKREIKRIAKAEAAESEGSSTEGGGGGASHRDRESRTCRGSLQFFSIYPIRPKVCSSRLPSVAHWLPHRLPTEHKRRP